MGKAKKHSWRFMAEVLCPLPSDERWRVYVASQPKDGQLWQYAGTIAAESEQRAVSLASQYYEARPLNVIVEK